MTFLLQSYLLHLKRIAKNSLFVTICILLVISISVISFFYRQNEKIIAINAGILVMEHDIISDRVLSKLLNNQTINFIFFEPEQEDEMIIMVKNRRLECAYILNPSMLDNILNERFGQIISLIKSPATISDGIINEAVYAALLEASADIISANTAATTFKLDAAELETMFRTSIDEYYDNNIFVKPIYQHVNSPHHGEVDISAMRVLHGVLVLLLFTYTYFSIPRYLRDKEQKIYATLKGSRSIVYYTSIVLALTTFSFLMGIFSLGLIRAVYPAALVSMSIEIQGLFALSLSMQLFALFVILILRKSEILYASFIFVLLFQVLFGNLFVDLNEFSGVLGLFQVLPSAFYMNYLL